MSGNIFTHYDSIRVISLPERTDRRRAVARELDRIGARYEFFDAFRTSQRGIFLTPGAFGNFLAHMTAIGQAAYRNESVLILEDDCAFTDDAATTPVPDVDLYWAGYERKSGDPEVIIGAQCVGYTAETARRVSAYLAAILDPASPPEPVATRDPGFDPEIKPPFDGALVWFMRSHPDVSVAFAQLAVQRASRSDITPSSSLDRIPLVRDLAQVARSILKR